MENTRIFDILENSRTSYRDKADILANKVDKEWVKYNSEGYYTNAHQLSYGLLALGLRKGDRVATISNNRPEWNFMDMAILQAGMIHVPIYPTLSEDDYSYILGHCQPRVLIVSDKSLYERLMPIAGKIKDFKDTYTFNNVEFAPNWTEILMLGMEQTPKYVKELDDIKKDIQPEELATIIYTSGTTGNPKGVMLSHKNIMSNVKSAGKVFDMGVNDRCLSFLPISHIFERTINYYFQSAGMSIYYAESLGTISENLKEVKPTVFIAVPRVLERIYDKIIGVGKDLKGIKKQIFFWAVNLGLRYKLDDTNSWWYKKQLKLADKLVFAKWRQAIGGNTRLIVAGGAALQPRLAKVFQAAGMPLLEGYGMTETSPVIACNAHRPGFVKEGTVGPVFPDVQVKISGDGEILVKGESVMMGYYKDDEQTKAAFDTDGWLHTGDVGTFVENRFLKITDRKKEMFKLSSGKYIAPQMIENKFKESFFIEQLMVVGENKKFASALISPNFPFLHNWCALHGVKYRDNDELIKNKKVIARYQREVSAMNKHLGQTEQIKRFRLVHEEWSVNTGELSPTLKLKRRFVAEKYKELLDDIYSVEKQEM